MEFTVYLMTKRIHDRVISHKMNRYPLKTLLFPLIAFLGLFLPVHLPAQLIWEETFSSYPNGTQNSGRWTTTFGDCDDAPPYNVDGAYWGVFDGRFRVNDIEGTACDGNRGNNSSSFTTETIDISGAGCVTISVVVASSGPLNCGYPGGPFFGIIPLFNGHDQLVVEYRLDGGAWTLFPNNGYFCGSQSGTATANDLSGNTLRIRIRAGTQANAENYFFDNIRVTGTTTNYTLPALGPFCSNDGNQALPTTNGGVTGTWSGTGVSGNTFRPTVVGPGTYTLTFTPAAGQCALPMTRTVTVNAAADFAAVADQEVCDRYILPAIQGVVVPANAAYYTAPNGGGVRYEPGEILTSSDRIYIYGGNAGCTDQVSFQVTITPEPDLDGIGDQTACGSFIFPAITGDDLHAPRYYTGPGGTGTAYAPGDTYTVPGNRRFYIYDEVNGCSDQVSFDLTLTAPPRIDNPGTQRSCGTFTFPPVTGNNLIDPAYYSAPNGGGTRWEPGSSLNRPAGTYTFYVYDGSAGCSDQVSFPLIVGSPAQLNRPNSVSVCGAYVLPPITGTNLQGPTGYSTQPGGGGQQLSPGDTVRVSGRYYAFDGSDACFVQDSFTITIRPKPAFALPAVDTFCDQYPLPPVQGTNLSATAGYFTQPGGMGEQLAAGDTLRSSQVVFLYDNLAGCPAQDSLVLTGYSTPQLSLVPDQEVCDSFLLPAVAGTNLLHPRYVAASGAIDSVLLPGDFIAHSGPIFITDRQAVCADTTSFLLTVNRVALRLEQTDSIACFGDPTGSLEVTVEEGAAPFQYDWSVATVGDEAFAQNLTADTYSVTVTDQNNCTATVAATITQPQPLSVQCDSIRQITVPRGSDGHLRARYSGGVTPYHIYLDGPVVDSVMVDSSGWIEFANLTAGDYQLLVVDGNDCTTDCLFTLVAPPCDLLGNPVVVPPQCTGEANGEITLMPTGGTAPYRYDWSVDSLDGRAFAQNLPAGNYAVTVTGFNGCTFDTTLTLTDPAPLTLACSHDSTSAVLDLSGGRLPYTITYAGPLTDTVLITALNGPVLLTDLLPGDYLVSVVDSGGCATQCALYIPDPACALTMQVEVTPESCPNLHDGQLRLSTTGGVHPVGVTWADGSLDSLRTGLSPGTYSVRIEDDLGCRLLQSVTLGTEHPTPTYQVEIDADKVCANGCDTVRLRARGSGPFRATLDISATGQMIDLALDFPEDGNRGTGQINVPVCLPDLGLSGDTLRYEVRQFTDAFCPNDTVIGTQTAIIPLDTARLDTLVCPETVLEIGGVTFDRLQPEGVVPFPGAARTGCDSFLSVALQFRPTDTLLLAPTLCYADTLLVNGSPYHRGRPAGLERLPQMAANGCDSLIQVDAVFLPEKRDTVAPMICRSDTVSVNGQAYFFGESQGTEIITGVGAENCDSTVVVDLQFFPVDTTLLDTLLCTGDSLLIGINRYDQFSPAGTEVFTGTDGCDSVVQVAATFRALDTTFLNPVLCFGDSLIVGRERFDAARPQGEVVFPRLASEGCDSTVMVNLTFRESRDTVIQSTLCPEENLLVNGNRYDVNRPAGTEFISGGSRNGCDSTIMVALQFHPADTGLLRERRCPDQPLTIFGETFTPERPAGIIRLPAASRFGCDSLIDVRISYPPQPPSLDLPREITIRQGDSVVLDPRYNFTPTEIRWTSNPPLDIPAEPRPVIAPTQNVSIELYASDLAGCGAKATTRVIVDRRTQAYAPNAFRPGAAESNGGFTIFGGNQLRKIEILRIFDRWGNLIFTGQDIPPNEPSLGWNGRADGQDMPGGVYIFSATVRLADGRREQIQGDVLLVRE